MPVELSAEARARVDGHLDAVEKVLAAAGNTREQRRAVVDDLEAQILEMLAAMSGAPGAAEVEAVLAKLDPPGAYGAERRGTAMAAPLAGPPAMASGMAKPRYSRTAMWGLACILVSLVVPVLLLPLGFFFTSRAVAVPAPVNLAREGGGGVVRLEGAGTRATVVEVGGAETSGTLPAAVAGGHGGRAEVHVYPARHSAHWGILGVVPCLGIMVGPLGLLGTVLGWVAFGQIRSSKGALVGMGMALFDGLFYPALVVLLGMVALLFVA